MSSRALAVAVAATALLQACATSDDEVSAPQARFDDRCYVTGSRIKVRTPDCRDSIDERGVRAVDPAALRDLPRGGPLETTR
jgi:hypothetical protein